jgi:hypothetical protein
MSHSQAVDAKSQEEPTMANRVTAYHSTNQTDPDVHHVFSDCPNGQQIPSANRRSGTNGWPLCGSCKNLGG